MDHQSGKPLRIFSSSKKILVQFYEHFNYQSSEHFLDVSLLGRPLASGSFRYNAVNHHQITDNLLKYYRTYLYVCKITISLAKLIHLPFCFILYSCVAFDMRGVGDSDAPAGVSNYTMDKLVGMKRIILILSIDKLIIMKNQFSNIHS